MSNNVVYEHYLQLYNKCGDILESSLSDPEQLRIHSISHNYISDYQEYIKFLENKLEVDVLKNSLKEYQFALLSLTIGHYRQAFMSLRLFFELSLGAIYFSLNEVNLREWLYGKQDIKWAIITDENNGLFSKRLVRAFFSNLENDIEKYLTLSKEIYRDCSEYVHGNIYTHNILDSKLSFKQEVFIDWHKKTKDIFKIISLVFFYRYFDLISRSNNQQINSILVDHLHQVQSVQSYF